MGRCSSQLSIILPNKRWGWCWLFRPATCFLDNPRCQEKCYTMSQTDHIRETAWLLLRETWSAVEFILYISLWYANILTGVFLLYLPGEYFHERLFYLSKTEITSNSILEESSWLTLPPPSPWHIIIERWRIRKVNTEFTHTHTKKTHKKKKTHFIYLMTLRNKTELHVTATFSYVNTSTWKSTFMS